MGRNLSPYMPGLLYFGNPFYMTPESLTVPSQYCMLPGDYITSDNGTYVAMVLDNGLFAMYHGSNPNTIIGNPLWISEAFQASTIHVSAPQAPCYFALLMGSAITDDDTSMLYIFSNFGCFTNNPISAQNLGPWYSLESHSTVSNWSLQWQYANQAGPAGADALANPNDFNIYKSFFWKISDIGQFEIYTGTSPADPSAALWMRVGPPDPVVSCVITSLEYHTDQATFLPTGSGYKKIAFSDLQVNDSASTNNTVTWSGSATVGYSSGWSNSLSETYGTSTTIGESVSTSDIPCVNASFDISVTNYSEFTNTTELNGNQSWEASIGYSLTFTVPPYTVMQGIAQIANGKLTVPFTVTGLLTYSSGTKLQTTGTGTYVGDNCLTAAVFTVDIGYSVITVNVDSSADYSACFCLQILSPSDQSVIYTSAYSSSIEPSGSQSIDLADILHPPANYFFVGGEQTRMLPLVKLSNGTVIKGPSVQVYKPSRGNSHVSVYDCYGTLTAPACLFNSNQSG